MSAPALIQPCFRKPLLGANGRPAPMHLGKPNASRANPSSAARRVARACARDRPPAGGDPRPIVSRCRPAPPGGNKRPLRRRTKGESDRGSCGPHACGLLLSPRPALIEAAMAGLRPARETASHGMRRGVALVPRRGCTLNERRHKSTDPAHDPAPAPRRQRRPCRHVAERPWRRFPDPVGPRISP